MHWSQDLVDSAKTFFFIVLRSNAWQSSILNMKNPDANLYLAVSKNPISNGNNIEGYKILSGSSETWVPMHILGTQILSFGFRTMTL